MEKVEPKVKLTGIDELAKLIHRRPDQGFSATIFNFDIKAESRLNPPQKNIFIIVDINVRELNGEVILASITIACIFEVENFDEIIKKQNDTTFSVPTDLDNLLKTISISTARGVLYSELRGTYIGNAILPIVILPPAPTPTTTLEKKEISTPST
jgi:hypothetical protein